MGFQNAKNQVMKLDSEVTRLNQLLIEKDSELYAKSNQVKNKINLKQLKVVFLIIFLCNVIYFSVSESRDQVEQEP